jgi:N-acyl-D-amino-acid deacylase
LTQRSSAEGVVIARFVPAPQLEGLPMVPIAAALGCAPAEAVMRLYERGDASVILHAMQAPAMATIAQHPLIAVGSDGSSLAAQGLLSVGKPHPRSDGTNPRFLAQFVR